jgi:hypothetical protein
LVHVVVSYGVTIEFEFNEHYHSAVPSKKLN